MNYQHKWAPYSLSTVFQVSGGPEIQIDLRTVFEAKIITAAAKLKVQIEVVNIFYIDLGTQDIWRLASDKLHSMFFLVFFVVVSLHFKTSPQLLQLFRRTMQRCFSAKLQKCLASR